TAFSGLVTAPSTTSYDEIGCAAIASVVATGGNIVDGLGGVTSGIDGTGCALPCQGPVPTNPPMQAGGQHPPPPAGGAGVFDGALLRCALQALACGAVLPAPRPRRRESGRPGERARPGTLSRRCGARSVAGKTRDDAGGLLSRRGERGARRRRATDAGGGRGGRPRA